MSGMHALAGSQAAIAPPLAYNSTMNIRSGMEPSESYLNQLRITEALLARDQAIYHMEKVCASNRAKESTIAALRQEKENLEVKLVSGSVIKAGAQNYCEETDKLRKLNAELTAKLDALSLSSQPGTPMPSPAFLHDVLSPTHDTPKLGDATAEFAEAITQGRFAILADLPIPKDMPNDTLVPIIIPTPFTLQDFLGSITGPMRAHLTNYRVFQEATTSWCPDREEHGYYMTPLFRCSTSPRAATAHRWSAIDLDVELNKSSECFFNKDGKWYYAGVYRTFKLPDTAPQEWTKLPPETTQAVVKETLHHRKNVSPQNIYETGQLYAAGALKAACIGLQCVGFNDALYNNLLAQAEVCAKTGRWRGTAAGLGTGAVWNAGANPGAGAIADSGRRTGSPKLGGSVSGD